MIVWAISDLHLSHARPMPREQFAERWQDHARKIAAEWDRAVGRQDLVLIPGDISMARNHREVQPDLAWLARRPGLKVLAPGNHDAWFNRIDRVRPMLRPGTLAVAGDATTVPGAVVCGARGTPVPGEDATADEIAASARSVDELSAALEQAATLRLDSIPLIVLWHYPPFDRYGQPGPIVPLLEAAGASLCVYGHLHAEGQWGRAIQGIVGGVRYACVAADAVGFRPLRLSVGDA